MSNQSVTLLVDSSSLIFRALFSTPDTVRAPDGTLVNAAHGFLGMLARLITDRNPDYICCAADDNWRPEWRVKLLDTYKSHRAAPGSAQEQAERRLAPQIPIIFGILEALGVPVLGFPDYEAEDVIGTLAARAPGRVEIVSGDRDLFQLVRDPVVTILYPRRGVSQMDVVDESYVAERYGIPGRAYRDYAVLRGDPSDGLPGVRGVGDKLAASLVAQYGSLEKIIQLAESGEGGATIGKVRRDLEYVERAVQVVTIPTNLPLPVVDLTRPREKPDEEVYSLVREMALEGAVRRLATAIAS